MENVEMKVEKQIAKLRSLICWNQKILEDAVIGKKFLVKTKSLAELGFQQHCSNGFVCADELKFYAELFQRLQDGIDCFNSSAVEAESEIENLDEKIFYIKNGNQ